MSEQMPDRQKGQLSLEALLAFAALLSALSMLVFSSEKMAEQLRHSAGLSAEDYSLSYEALCLDTAAGSLGSSLFAHNLSGAPSQDGMWLYSHARPSARQMLFHEVTQSQEGTLNVQKQDYEPV